MKEINKDTKIDPKFYELHEEDKVEGKYKTICDIIETERSFHPKTLLDVGCGVGELTTFLNKNIEYTGVDNSKKRIDYARRKYKGKFIHSFGEELPFGNNTFDFVVLTEVIEHVENPLKLLKECRRILKVGGMFIGSTPNATDINRVIKSVFRKDHGHIEHMHVFGSFEIKTTMKCAGFKDTKIIFTKFNLNWYKRKIKIYSSIMTKLLPNFADCIIFYGKNNEM